MDQRYKKAINRAYYQLIYILNRSGTVRDIDTTSGYKGTDNMSEEEIVVYCKEMNDNYERFRKQFIIL